MFGGVITRAGRVRDEAEKPFWISYADLMTALMVLFLVVMTVALVSVTEEVDVVKEREKQQSAAVEELLNDLELGIKAFKGAALDRDRRTIEFGTRARFGDNQATLSQEQQRQLRQFVPSVLRVASSEKGRRWIRRVVVEGYTSKTGDYLYNLNLSLRRSQSFLCALFASTEADGFALSPEQLRQVRSLFIVGGYSANLAKETDEASRRVELRVEFYGPNPDEFESRSQQQWPLDNFGTCESRWLQ
jgi:outer membrane protein OmpA-like peptidoglycan-associated protein